MTRLTVLLAAAATALGFVQQTAAARPNPVPVDLQLVLAVDVSFSMDVDEQELQRQGYLTAITSNLVLGAIRQGKFGRIAVAYVEWSGAAEQRTVINWTLIDGAASAAAFAAKLSSLPLHRAARTSISGALTHAAAMFEGSGFVSPRKVIDISGDGPNNEGALVERSRDAAVAQGVVVNGLPLMLKPATYAAAQDLPLDDYYLACVIGGEGSFMLPIRDKRQLAETIRTKLLTEIASLPKPLIETVAVGPARFTPAVAKAVDCNAGERLWGDD